MGYPTRIYYSESDRQKIFDRWLAGESQNAIARSFGRSHSSIQDAQRRGAGQDHERGIDPGASC